MAEAASPALRQAEAEQGALPCAKAPSRRLSWAQSIAGLAALESIDLCANQLRRGGACALAKACAGKPGLQLLALDENEISDAGVDALKVRSPLPARHPFHCSSLPCCPCFGSRNARPGGVVAWSAGLVAGIMR